MAEHLLEYLIRFGIVLLLVAANGFFVASEFALVGVRKTRIETMAKTGNRRAKRLQRVLHALDSYISATQLGITLASLALGWVGEAAFAEIFKSLFLGIFPAPAAAVAAETAAIAMAFTVITVLHIVLGELAPKTLALERTELVALAVAWPMEIFYRTFKAPIWLLNKGGNVVVRLAGLTATAEHAAAYTEEEIRHLVDISHKSGHLNEGERELIHNVFEFAAETVRDCMVPRTGVVVVAADATVPQLIELFQTTEYSRIPVYEGSPDAIVGVLHAKQVLSAALKGIETSARALARPTLFLPPSAQLDHVLARMKRTGQHLAVVVDEHGGLEGIITLEDILEEIVGEIRDEFDEGESVDDPVSKQSDGSYLIDAAMPVRAFNRRLDFEIPESNQYATIAGFLLAQAGTIPKQGDAIEHDGNRFVVENIRRNRLVTVRLHPRPKPADDADENGSAASAHEH